MPRKIIWLRDEVIVAAHHRQLVEHGGLPGIRDANLLASALAKPQNLMAYQRPKPSLAQLAASYAYGIACNHPFNDGNKRTALIACRLFLKRNGKNLTATQAKKYTIIIKLAAGELTESQLAEWVAERLADQEPG